jgi:uncharacterized membrane protein YbhN (UPF0104 family)
MASGTRATIGWISLSAGLVLVGLGSLAPVMMVPMMFDAPGSESNPLVIILAAMMVAFPLLCLISAILPWLFWRKSFAKWLFLPPILDLAAIVLMFVALEQFCHGQFRC